MNSKILTPIDKFHPILWQIICIGISAASFSAILANRSPNLLRPLSMSLRTGFGLVIPTTVIIVYLAFRIPGRVGELISMVVTLSLFAMPLAGLWASGQSQTTVLNGIIPLYDAETYYLDALGLLNGSRFSVFSARRSLFSGLLSVLLLVTNSNLMASLAILTGITGFACYFAVREIQRTHGAEVATFILTILFLFYRAHSGISMSENIGVSLGTLGFGLIWNGTSRKNIGYTWLGLLSTTLALNARAGAFFMLPLLILWTGWLFRENKWISWKALVLSMSAVVLGFGLNFSLTRLVAVPSGVPFANFSYTLYGLASGGKSWAYVFEAHPEVLSIKEPEQSRKIYQLAFELIKEKPLQMVKGAFFNWKMLFSNTWYNVYSYVGGESWKINVTARWGMYLLCLLGIFSWMQDSKDPIKTFIMVSSFGVFISVPFLPPTDAYRMRPYAASIIILAALPALGVDLITKKTIQKLIPYQNMVSASSPILVIFSVALILTTWLGPVLIKSAAREKSFTAQPCPAPQNTIEVRFAEGTFVNIRKEKESFLDWMPNFHFGLFRENAHSLAENNLIQWAQTIEPPKTLFLALDYISKQKVLVVAPTDMLPKPDTYIQACGRFETDPALSPFAIYYAEQIQVLSP